MYWLRIYSKKQSLHPQRKMIGTKMTRVSPHLIYQLISPLSWKMLICHNTLLDRLWLEVIWSPPTELAEGTRCREVAPDTKLRASSFEMNLETSSSFISIFEGIQFYWAKFAMYFSDPSGINNRSSIFLFILPQKKIFPPNNFLVFFSSFFFPLMDQIFSKRRGQKMEKKFLTFGIRRHFDSSLM